jgi:hypothetical protein
MGIPRHVTYERSEVGGEVDTGRTRAAEGNNRKTILSDRIG